MQAMADHLNPAGPVAPIDPEKVAKKTTRKKKEADDGQ